MKPKVQPKFTRAILLHQLATPFVARGGDIHEVLRRNGLPVELLHDPNQLVEAAALYPVFEDMADMLGDPYFCADVARDGALKGIPQLERSATAKSLGDFLIGSIVETGQQFDNVEHSLIIKQRAAVYSIRRTRWVDRPTIQTDAIGVAFYVTVFRHGLGDVFDASQIVVSAPSIEGVPPGLVPASSLARSCKTALSFAFPPLWLAAAFSLNWPAPNRLSDSLDQQPGTGGMTLAFVRATIQSNIAHKEFDLDALAYACRTSRRGLQRILSAHGTSFRTLQDDVRRETAIELVTASNTPLKDVASKVGFSSETTLTRSYSRWTGEPPAMHRRRASRSSAKNRQADMTNMHSIRDVSAMKVPCGKEGS